MKQLRYAPRARFCGNVEWLCPYCATLNRHRLFYSSRQFECRGRNCSRRFHLGLWAHTRQGSGGRLTFSDPFPAVEVREMARKEVGGDTGPARGTARASLTSS